MFSIAFLLLLAAAGLFGVASALRAIARDGYRRRPSTRPVAHAVRALHAPHH